MRSARPVSAGDSRPPAAAAFCFTVEDTQAVKGVAILLMIWHHLFGFPEYYSYDHLLPFNLAFYLGRFGKVCVSLYLFLSGYGLTCSAVRSPLPIWRATGLRLRKFYVSFWFYFVLLVPYGLFVLRTGRFANQDVVDVLYGLVGLADHHVAYDVAWWFIRVYVPLLALFPLFYRLACAHPLLLPVAGLGLLGVQTRIWEGTLAGGVLFWQMPFVLGIYAARTGLFESETAARAARQPAWWHGAVLAALFLFRFRAGGGGSVRLHYRRAVCLFQRLPDA